MLSLAQLSPSLFSPSFNTLFFQTYEWKVLSQSICVHNFTDIKTKLVSQSVKKNLWNKLGLNCGKPRRKLRKVKNSSLFTLIYIHDFDLPNWLMNSIFCLFGRLKGPITLIKFSMYENFTSLNMMQMVKILILPPFSSKLVDLAENVRLKGVECQSVSVTDLRKCQWVSVMGLRKCQSVSVIAYYGHWLTLSQARYGDSLTFSQLPLVWHFQLNEFILRGRVAKMTFSAYT